MAAKARNIRSAILMGEARFERWREKFEREFEAERGRMMLRERVLGMSIEELQAWKQTDPEGYEAALREIR